MDLLKVEIIEDDIPLDALSNPKPGAEDEICEGSGA